jgi:putative transposase
VNSGRTLPKLAQLIVAIRVAARKATEESYTRRAARTQLSCSTREADVTAPCAAASAVRQCPPRPRPRTFQECGLPQGIRTDNDVPFASAHAIYGLSKLAVWWLRLGIQIERITPGHPQQNGRHERMHLTLKREATKPGAPNVLQQQARFDDFLTRYNTDRPHQALGMQVSADLHARSARVYRGLEELTYQFHDHTAMVTRCGRICFRGRKVNLSHVFAGQSVGVTQVGEHIWLVTFMQCDLAYFDDETCRLEPMENPFGPKVLPMCSE